MKNPLKSKPRTNHFHENPQKPDWLKVPIRFDVSESMQNVRSLVQKNRLHTVCESASCPNLNHCWTKKTATFLLAGDICTRKCLYCDVASGKPKSLDLSEPKQIADAVRELGLKFVVLTSVNRDDLEDGGALHYKNTIQEIRNLDLDCKIEVLIPDFKGNQDSLDLLYSAKPDIINHNIETVKSLYKTVAPQKKYETSLFVLRNISENGFIAKSGLMLGMGERWEEILDCIQDLHNSQVSLLTIGQYIPPSKTHHPVQDYTEPHKFVQLKDYALKMGFRHVESGPLVRSSYHAENQAKSSNL